MSISAGNNALQPGGIRMTKEPIKRINPPFRSWAVYKLGTPTSSLGSRVPVHHIWRSFKGEKDSESPDDKVATKEWKSSLHYPDSQIAEIKKNLLTSHNFEPSESNLKWLDMSINALIEGYETEYDVKLDNSVRKMLENLIVKMSYDLL